MVSYHQNAIVERRIKELTPCTRTLILHATRLWPESVSTMIFTFSFKAAFHRYNSLEMDEEGRTPGNKSTNVKFQIWTIDYHTWGWPVFVLEAPLQGGPSGITKWEPISRTGYYLVHHSFHYGSVTLVLNTITGHVSPQYHVVFGDTLSIVEHMGKGTVPENWENMVEEHSDLSN